MKKRLLNNLSFDGSAQALFVLRDALLNGGPMVVEKATEVIVRVSDNSRMDDFLIELLSHESPAITPFTQTLMRFAPLASLPKSTEILIAHGNADLRNASATHRAFELARDSQSEILGAMLKNTDPFFRKPAATEGALKAAPKSKLYQHSLDALNDSDPIVRDKAFKTLKEYRGQDFSDAEKLSLLGMMMRDNALRQDSLLYLYNDFNMSEKTLLELAQRNEDPNLHRAAEFYLTQVQAERARIEAVIGNGAEIPKSPWNQD